VEEPSAPRSQDDVSLIVDLDAPKALGVVATLGRDHTTVARFAEELAALAVTPSMPGRIGRHESRVRPERASKTAKAYLTWTATT
jgi:hypothetical protein